MLAVEWQRIDKEKATEIIAMLLKHLFPDAERIWGAGGDEGRDVQIRLPDGRLRAFEIKSFADRITKSRKQQIKESLSRAAQLNPVDWTLLMPLDPTPKEEGWLCSLRGLVPFPTNWHGRLFLDTELAQRPWIERYVLGDTARELQRLMEQVGLEQAALANGAPDAIERIVRVASDLNEMDPFYVWRIASDGAHTTISPYPRYRGAEVDHPLRIELSFRFPDDQGGRRAAEDVKQHFDFGTPLDIGAEYVDHVKIDSLAFPGGMLPPGRITATSHPGRAAELLLAVTGPDGQPSATVAISGVVTSSGQRGSVLDLAEATGALKVHLTVDIAEQRATLNFSYSLENAYYPAQLRQVIVLLSEMAPPNLLQVRSLEGKVMSSSPISENYARAGDERFLRLLDDLALIQWASGQLVKVGPDFSEDDLREIAIAVLLLRGESLAGTWNEAAVTLTDDASPETRRLWTKDEFRMTTETAEPYVARICGHDYLLGKGVRLEVDAATMAPEHDSWREDSPPPGARIRLVSGSSNVVRRTLLNEVAPPTSG